LMALRRFQQKTMDGGGGGIGGLPPTTLDEDVNKFARDGDFVSPTIEALIRNAPKNIKGKQIIEYLNSKGAPSAGVKPKELPYLGIERFIEENPNATLPEVIEHAGKNKVQVGEVVYKDLGQEGSDFYFDSSTPEFDPLSGEIVYQHIIDDIVYDVKNKEGAYVDDILDSYVQRLTPDELMNNYGYVDPNQFTVDDMINRINKSVESGASTETLEDIIEEKARDIYFINPYKLIEPKGGLFTGRAGTFVFGNDDVGYQTFVNGERIDIKDYGYDDVAYSATEAEVRLQNILEERGELNLNFENQKYKTYVDETLPGGKNYSEKVYTFDNADDEFRGGHFPEKTQIAHKLGRDRLLEDGTLSLHADEIQSDIGKQGLRFGYKDPIKDPETIKEINAATEKSLELHLKVIERMSEEMNEIKELASKHPELNEYRGKLDADDRDLAIRQLSGEDQGQIVFEREGDTGIFLDYLRRKYGDSANINYFRVPSRIQVLERDVKQLNRLLSEYQNTEANQTFSIGNYRATSRPHDTMQLGTNATPETVTTTLKEFKKLVNKPNYTDKINKLQELRSENFSIEKELQEDFRAYFDDFNKQYPDAIFSSDSIAVRARREEIGKNMITGGLYDLAYKELRDKELNTLASRANTNLDVLSDPRNVDVTNPALARLLDADLNFRETPSKALEQIDKIKSNRQAIGKLTDDTTIDMDSFFEVQDNVSNDLEALRVLDGETQQKIAKLRNAAPNFPFKGEDYGEMVLKKMILDAIAEGKDAVSTSASTPILERYALTPGSDEAQFFERFYDKTLPKSMDKIAKKYGGKFERGSLDLKDTFGEPSRLPLTKAEDSPEAIGLGFLEEREPQRFYDTIEIASAKANILRITPEMKAKIKKEGLPLFNMGGKVTKSKFMDKPIEGNRREM